MRLRPWFEGFILAASTAALVWGRVKLSLQEPLGSNQLCVKS